MSIDFKEDVQPLFKPLLIAVAAFIAGAVFFNWEVGEEDSAGQVTMMVIGAIFIAIGAGFILWPGGKFMLSIFEGIFWPQDSYKAPANYKLPEWYCQQGRYGEALEEYEKIISNYPREQDAWVGLLNVYLYYMGDSAHGEQVYQRALKALKGTESESVITEHYQVLRSSSSSSPTDHPEQFPQS
ncbi:MAG: hypothetical protein AAFY98_01830 [Verrucomicrobiota bacterium]